MRSWNAVAAETVLLADASRAILQAVRCLPRPGCRFGGDLLCRRGLGAQRFELPAHALDPAGVRADERRLHTAPGVARAHGRSWNLVACEVTRGVQPAGAWAADRQVQQPNPP